MRRIVKAVLTTVLTVSLLAFFVGIASVLYVRSAIAGGALDNPNTCVTARDMDKLEAGPNQQLADWWVSRRVYDYHVGDNRGPGLGWRGALAYYGMKLALSPAERVDLAYASMRRLRICGQPIEET
jgi:hypothetical protein